jgi:hypothetical protein
MHFRPFGHHHWHFAVSPIFLAIFLIFDSSTIFGQNHKRHQHSFRENCADEHDKVKDNIFVWRELIKDLYLIAKCPKIIIQNLYNIHKPNSILKFG